MVTVVMVAVPIWLRCAGVCTVTVVMGVCFYGYGCHSCGFCMVTVVSAFCMVTVIPAFCIVSLCSFFTVVFMVVGLYGYGCHGYFYGYGCHSCDVCMVTFFMVTVVMVTFSVWFVPVSFLHGYRYGCCFCMITTVQVSVFAWLPFLWLRLSWLQFLYGYHCPGLCFLHGCHRCSLPWVRLS